MNNQGPVDRLIAQLHDYAEDLRGVTWLAPVPAADMNARDRWLADELSTMADGLADALAQRRPDDAHEIRAEEVRPGVLRITVRRESGEEFSVLASATPDRVDRPSATAAENTLVPTIGQAVEAHIAERIRAGGQPSKSEMEWMRSWPERLAAGEQHPWYGPCDGMGTGGECSECQRPESPETLAQRRPLIADAAELLRSAPVPDGHPWIDKAVEWLRRDGVPGPTSYFFTQERPQDAPCGLYARCIGDGFMWPDCEASKDSK